MHIHTRAQHAETRSQFFLPSPFKCLLLSRYSCFEFFLRLTSKRRGHHGVSTYYSITPWRALCSVGAINLLLLCLRIEIDHPAKSHQQCQLHHEQSRIAIRVSYSDVTATTTLGGSSGINATLPLRGSSAAADDAPSVMMHFFLANILLVIRRQRLTDFGHIRAHSLRYRYVNVYYNYIVYRLKNVRPCSESGINNNACDVLLKREMDN